MAAICTAMTQEEGEQFEDCLRALNSLFQKGYTHLFMTQTLLMRKMMNHFTKLGKELEVLFSITQEGGDDTKTQRRMLFVLSVIAELLRHNPKFYYPFTRKFLITLFSIDASVLEQSPLKSHILAILSVIFENLSRQSKLVSKYGMQESLKKAVLEGYSLIEEVFTLKTMDKTISNMVNSGIAISGEEFEKYQVLKTVSKIISRSQMDLFVVKMKMAMLYMNVDSLKKMQQPVS